MSPIEALQYAVSQEKKAIEIYRKMALDYPEIRDICTDLENEEFKHKSLLEKKIVELQKY